MTAAALLHAAIAPSPWLLIATIAAVLIAEQPLSRKYGVDITHSLTGLLVAGGVAARAGFVLRYATEYLPHPLSIIDIRDGGFDPLAGLAGVIACAVGLSLRRAKLRKPLAISCAVAVVVWVAGGAIFGVLTQTTHPQRPDLALQALNGPPVRLAQLAASAGEAPMVVNLWATWCPPCRAEMPMLAKAQRRYREVVFVFVNQGEAPNTVQRFLRSESLSLHNVLLDPNQKLASTMHVRGFPTTLVFDASGKLVTRHTGMLSAATLAHALHALPAS